MVRRTLASAADVSALTLARAVVRLLATVETLRPALGARPVRHLGCEQTGTVVHRVTSEG